MAATSHCYLSGCCILGEVVSPSRGFSIQFIFFFFFLCIFYDV